MKKIFNYFRDTVVAGLIFLLPIMILFVLITKVFQFLTGFTARIATMFGLKSFLGLSGGTIVGTISLLILILLCGYLVRISFFKQVSNWIDKKLASHVPGYSVYRKMAMSKLVEEEAALPYKAAAWIDTDGLLQPGFHMETLANGRLLVFIPSAGNAEEGAIFSIEASRVKLLPEEDMRAFKMAIRNLGIGFSELKN